jgi:hypothetical protein
MGYRCVSVPYFEWGRLGLEQEQQQQHNDSGGGGGGGGGSDNGYHWAGLEITRSAASVSAASTIASEEVYLRSTVLRGGDGGDDRE